MWEIFGNYIYNQKEITMLENELRSIKPATYNAVGAMHKYWGKKPYNVINEIINKYTSQGDTVLDPFMGTGTTAVVANALSRRFIGFDTVEKYVIFARQRVKNGPYLEELKEKADADKNKDKWKDYTKEGE